jgi:hypothetical protein
MALSTLPLHHWIFFFFLGGGGGGGGCCGGLLTRANLKRLGIARNLFSSSLNKSSVIQAFERYLNTMRYKNNYSNPVILCFLNFFKNAFKYVLMSCGFSP